MNKPHLKHLLAALFAMVLALGAVPALAVAAPGNLTGGTLAPASDAPITAISFEPVEPLVCYEGVTSDIESGGYDDEGNWVDEEWFYYYFPGFRKGDVMSVTYATESGEETTVYTCQREDYFEADNGDYLWFYELFGIDNNQEFLTRWTVGTHAFIAYLDGSQDVSCQIPVTVVENPVAAFSIERPSGTTLYKGISSYETTDEYWDDELEDYVETDSYNRYYIPPAVSGDVLTIDYTDGSQNTYEARLVDVDGYEQLFFVNTASGMEDDRIDPDDLDVYNSQSFDNQWGIGKHDFIYSYMGHEYSLVYEIAENPVSEIAYTPATPRKYIEVADSEEALVDSDDPSQGTWQWYSCGFEEGDMLSVTRNGNVTEYTYRAIQGEADDPDDDPSEYRFWGFYDKNDEPLDETLSTIELNYDQSPEHPWLPGHTYEATISYMGHTCALPVTIEANPVKSISYELAPGHVFEVYDSDRNREIISDSEDGSRDWTYLVCEYGIMPGDKIIVTSADDVETVYTFDDEEWEFIAPDGSILAESNLDFFDSNQSYDNQWYVGCDNARAFIRYMGREAEIPVTVRAPYFLVEVVPLNTNIFFCPDDAVDDFGFSYFYPGDKLILQETEESARKTYVYRDGDYDKPAQLVNIADPSDTINPDDIERSSEDDFHLGENEIAYYYKGVECIETYIVTQRNKAEYSPLEQESNGAIMSFPSDSQATTYWPRDDYTQYHVNGLPITFEAKPDNSAFDISYVAYRAAGVEHQLTPNADGTYTVPGITGEVTIIANQTFTASVENGVMTFPKSKGLPNAYKFTIALGKGISSWENGSSNRETIRLDPFDVTPKDAGRYIWPDSETYFEFESDNEQEIDTFALSPADAGTVTVKHSAAGHLTLAIALNEPATLQVGELAQLPSIALSSTQFTYTGKAIKPAVTIKDGDYTLEEGFDYKLTYTANVNAGTATVKAVGMGGYKGESKATFTIKKASIAKATFAKIANQKYTGKQLKPAVKVTAKVGGANKVLSSKTDYTVKYTANTNVGTATITVTGKGNYTGTAKTTFKIVAAANSVTLKKTSVTANLFVKNLKSKAGSVALPKATAKFGTPKWSVSTKDKKGVLTLKAGKIQVKKGAKKGTYTIKVKAAVAKTKNYAGANKVATVKVTVK